MSVEELEIVRGLLRQTDLEMQGPVEAARANLEELLAHAPIPEQVEFTSAEVGGVPALVASDPEVNSVRTVLYLHGGAFTIGSAHAYRGFSATVARACNARGISIDYRLAPEHEFPAAVDDCLAAYRGLLEEGTEPASIAVVGDSAGGGLVVSLLIAAREEGLPMPGAGVCLSPWSDLTCSGDTFDANDPHDLSINADDLRAMAVRYARTRLADPLASPVLADLRGLPPLLIHVGSVELLLDDAIALARRAGSDHVKTTLEIWPGMPHVWHSFGFMLGEGAEATEAVGRFVRAHTAG